MHACMSINYVNAFDVAMFKMFEVFSVTQPPCVSRISEHQKCLLLVGSRLLLGIF